MKVKTSGFVLNFDGVNIFDFLRYLKKDIAYQFQNRILVVDAIENTDNLWGGYLLTLREEKITPQVKLTEDELELILQEVVAKGFHHAEFNFFLINGYSRKGLFQTYWNAARWTYFAFYLGHKFNKFKDDQRLRKVDFKPSPLFRQDAFEKYVEQFEWIKEITIEASHYEVQEKAFRIMNDQAQRRIEIFKYYKNGDWNLRAIKESLFSIFREEQASELKIEGEIAGVETVYTLANNVEVFYEEEHEKWIKNLIFTSKDRNNSVNNSQTIKELIRIYNETLNVTRLDQRDKEI